MKKKTLLLMLLMVLLAPWAVNAQTTIYSENFDSMSSEADLTAAGWISAGNSGCYIGITTSYYVSGSKSLLISAWDGGSSSDSEIAALPVLSQAINGLQITLSYRQRTGGTVQVGYITDVDDASTFVLVQSLASSTSGFTTTTVDLSTVPAGAARIAIKQYTWYDCYIDDIVVETLPTCFKPTALTVTLTPGDGTVATLNWTAGGEETAWVLQYDTKSDFSTATSVNVSGTPSKNLTGLTAETTYYARVKANCGGGDESSWSSSLTFKPTNQQYTLVYDGTPQTTNYNVPIYGYYDGYYQKTEIVYPASALTALNGKLIKTLKFYSTTANASFGAGYKVFMKELDATTISDFSGYNVEDVVYEGSLSIAGNEMTIEFDNEYEYCGGNLLIGIYHTEKTSSSYTYKYFNGQSITGASVSGYNYSSLASVTATQRNFIPKTQFGHLPNPYPMPIGLAYNNIDPQHTTLSWTAPDSENTITGYSYQYKTGSDDWSAATTVTSTSVTLTLEPETAYDFRVKANYEGDHESSFATISWTTLAACMTPENLTITNVTWNSATFNWTEGFGAGQWKLGYKTGSVDYTYVDVTLAELPKTLSVFDEQTTYDVVVYPLCDEGKTIVGSFTTLCNPETVGAEWKENFNSYTATTTSATTPATYPNDVLPDCWTWLNRSATSSTYPQVFLSSYSDYAVSDNCLFFKSSHTTPLYATLPAFSDNLSTLQVTFTYRNEGTGGSHGTLYVGYMTDPKDANTFTSVYTCAQTTTKTEKTVELTSAPNNGYITFKYIGAGDYDNYYASIDDIIVEPIPTCLRPYDVTKSNVTNYSATLNWTNGEEGQDAWQIAYKAGADFNPADPEALATATVVDVTTKPYTFNKTLDANTTYYMYVRANCGGEGYSKWSKDVCSFTTLVACPTPTALAANNVTHTTADLSWTGYSDSYTVEYRTAGYSEPAPGSFFDDFEGDWQWTNTREGDGTTSTDWRKVTASTFDEVTAHSGDYVACGRSWANIAYSVDNWMISPKVTLSGNLEYWVRDDGYYHEHYDVYISTTTAETSSFTKVYQPGNASSIWTKHTVDLSTYAGVEGYVAFRLTDEDQDYLLIDDVLIGTMNTIEPGEWNNEANNVAEESFQLTGLTANTKYDVRVKGNCGDEYSDEYSFTTHRNNTKIFTTEGNWNDAGNWSGGIPEAVNNAIIRANVAIPSGCIATADNVTIEGTPAPTITIKDGGQLVHNNYGLIVTTEKVITGYTPETNNNYYLISSPLFNDIDPTTVEGMLSNTYDLFYFNYNNVGEEWRNYKLHPFDIEGGVGYLYANSVETTLKFTGEAFPSNDNTFNITLSFANDDDIPFDGWNLIGNIFTCNAYMTKEDPTAEIDFYVIGGDDHNELVAMTGPIAPMEGVFIKATAASQKVYWNRTAPVTNSKNGKLNIALSNGNSRGITDIARIRFGEGEGLDKFQMNPNHTKLYIPQEGKDYAVVYTEAKGEMPLNFKAETTAKYTISISNEDIEFSYLRLIDNFTGANVDLLIDPEYTFIGSPRDDENRFRIVFSTNSAENENDVFVYQNDSELIVNGEGELQIYDVMGRFVTSMKINGSERISADNFSDAMYIFRLVGSDVKTQKIVVR